ncbi:MAG: alpha-hydroxy-acid oxidizing protein, partial [Anaerolineales bacterium]
AVSSEVDVMMDGGVRSGIDVLKAVALGACGVLIGRPWVYALAAAGEDGVANLLDTLQREIASAMVMIGVNRLEEISVEHLEDWRDHLSPGRPYQHGGDRL